MKLSNYATFPKIYLGTFKNRCEEYVDIDVNMATEFWQPYFLKLHFSAKGLISLQFTRLLVTNLRKNNVSILNAKLADARFNFQ